MNLQNLIDYYEWQNMDLWEGCSVPAPFSMNIVKDTIMSRCGLLTPIYGDPDVFKQLTQMWFYKNQWNFEHLAKVYNASYSPIENVYESDHWTEGHTGTDKRAFSGVDKNTLSGEDKFIHGETHTLSGNDTLTYGETHTESGSDTFTHGETHTLSGNDTLTHGEKHVLSGSDNENNTRATEHTVSAYNSGTYQADSKDVNSGDIKTTYGKTDTASGDDKTTYGKKDTASGIDTTGYGKVDAASGTDTTGYGKVDTASGTDTTDYGKIDQMTYGKKDDFTHGHLVTYNRLRHGNIGVTTNDELILEELSMLEKFNPYDWIAAKFERENFLQVY